MSTLQGTKIKDTYPGLLKATDNLPLSTTGLRTISDGNGNNTPLQLSQQEVHISAMGVNGEIQLQSAGNVTLLSGDASNGLQINNTNSLFAGDVDFSLATVTGLPSGGGLEPVQLSGTSQTLDLGTYNFFDGGTLAGDTTLTFSNVPAEIRFQYSYEVAATAYKIDGASYNGVNEIPSGVTQPAPVGFNSDGTLVFMLKADTSGDRLYAFALSTAYDLSTIAATSSADVLLDDGTDNAVGPGIYFKPDGTAFYTVGAQYDNVYEWTMTTAFDLSTASYSGTSFDISALAPTPRAVYFKDDGTRMYVIGRGFDKVNAWTLSTAWDIDSATFDNQSINVASQDNDPQGLAFNADGTKMFFSGAQNNSIYSYTLSTAWNVSSATYSAQFDTEATITGYLIGLVFDANGQKFYAADRNTGIVYQYDSAAAQVIFPASVQNPPSRTYGLGEVVTNTLYTLDSGTNVYIEEIPERDVSASPGLVSGAGADSITVSSAVVTSPSTASGSGAIALGDASFAQGNQNITIGQSSNSNGANIINIGDDNDMSIYSDNTVLVRPGGGTSIAFRGSSVALGVNSYPGASAVAIGYNARGGQNDANIVIGTNSYATGDGIAIGENSDAIGVKTVAIGSGAQATGSGSDGKIAIGNANVSKNKGIGIGVNGVSVASEGIAIGDNVDIAASSDRTIAIGNAINIAGGAADSIVMGTSADSTSPKGIALGYDAHVTATEGIALGYQVTAATDYTVTLKRLQMLDYASLNYADDTAAAAGGIPLGGVYHNAGVLRIRIA